jgi:hypothetical protein
MLLPSTALVIGVVTVARRWALEPELRRAAREVMAAMRVHLGTLLVTCATVAAAGVLAIVALHVATD